MYRIYEVKPGETLDSIASKLNITAEELANINGINVSTRLTPGAYIVIPNSMSSNLFSVYRVQKGDNIYSIARAYNTSPSELLKLNGLNANDIIYPNQEIYVPNSNTLFYVTEEGDTLNKVLSGLNASAERLSNLNNNIYLVPDQLIVYEK